MRKPSFALVSVLAGLGLGSAAIHRSNQYYYYYPPKPEIRNEDENIICVGLLDILTGVFQRPSSQLEKLVKLANSHDKPVKFRFEAIRLIATYWQQWSPRRRIFAARGLSPDSVLSLAAYGHRLDDSGFFPVVRFSEDVEFENLELSFVEGLKRLSSSAEVRLDPCSMIFIKNTLKEVEYLNQQVKNSLNFFKLKRDFSPFSVSSEEVTQMGSDNQPKSLIAKKLELFLMPILKSLENASRLNDHELASAICERLGLFELIGKIVRLEKPAEITDMHRRLVAAILANLASFKNEEFAKQQRRWVVEHGFLSLLRSWALDSSARMVSYEAIRALQNLDPFFSPKLKSTVGLYFPVWRSVFSASKPKPKLDVVFVHGIQGGAIWTWRQLGDNYSNPGACWPADWLPFDVDSNIVGQTRFFGVQYHSVLPGLSQCVEPLAFRARHLMLDLEMSGLGENNIVWITHSFGGIFVKSMLLQNDKFAENTKAVVFLSTPHLGSPIADQPAKYANILGLVSSELEEIRTDSPHLLQLRRAFIDLAAKFDYQVLSVSENQPTNLLGLRALSAVVVPEHSALGAGCGRQLRTEVDHLSTCKPANRECPVYISILDTVNRAFFDKK